MATHELLASDEPVVVTAVQEPTLDERAATTWWNRQTDLGRRFWIEQAEASGLDCSAAGAWAVFKRQRGRKAVRP